MQYWTSFTEHLVTLVLLVFLIYLLEQHKCLLGNIRSVHYDFKKSRRVKPVKENCDYVKK